MSHDRVPRRGDLGYHACDKRRMTDAYIYIRPRRDRDARPPQGLPRAQAAARARRRPAAAPRPPPGPARRWRPRAPRHGRRHRRARRRSICRSARVSSSGCSGPTARARRRRSAFSRRACCPRAGRRSIGGADVVADAVAVRRRIGVVPQRPNPDRGLDVLENLIFHAAYFGFPRGGLARARPRHPRAPRPRRSRALARRRAVGRPAPAAHDRARARARAARDLPRRAHGGARSAGAPRAVGDPARAARRGTHDRHDDALHGGGREAVRARRHRRPRQAAGVRLARRAQEAGARRHARRAARSTARRRPRARRRAPSRACSTSSTDGATLRVYHPDGGEAVARAHRRRARRGPPGARTSASCRPTSRRCSSRSREGSSD